MLYKTKVHQKVHFFLMLLYRDLYVYRSRLKDYFINDGLLRPILYALVFGLLLPAIGMHSYGHKGPAGVSFVGTIIYVFLPLATSINFDVLFDFESDHHLRYLVSISNPVIVFLEKVMVGTLLLCVGVVPYFVTAKMVLGSYFDLSHTNFFALVSMLLISAFFITNFVLCAFCYMPDMSYNRLFWRRFVFPLAYMSGFLVTWHVIKTFSPTLAYCMLINPFVYILEGVRRALFGLDIFFPCWICGGMLLVFATIFMLLGIYLFRKKLDCLL